MENWDAWVEKAVARLAAQNLLITPYPISLAVTEDHRSSEETAAEEFELFDGPRPWDRATVEVTMKDSVYREWLKELSLPSANDLEGEPDGSRNEKGDKKMVLFSNNDYLAVTNHPMVRKAASEAAWKHGMGARSSIVSCGYTDYHHRLAESLARLKTKEACVICPTGFAANMAFMAAVGSVASLTTAQGRPSKNEKVAIFSDSLNHGSIIDGIRLAERSQEAECFVYRHSDMSHLESLLSSCPMKKKVAMTDSLFSMDGDFALMPELIELRRKYGFLLAVDDAHGTLVCGKTGGGVLEEFDCEDDVDICVGTLSKAIACHGGFIACSNKWRQVIESRGRAFILSTAIPVPVAAAAHASVVVGREEGWRRKVLWGLLREFNSLTGLDCTSPIIPMVIGNQEATVQACRKMIESGMHVVPIKPPVVHPDACRLRITLTSGHTIDDIRRLVDVLSQFTKLPAMEKYIRTSKL